MLCSLSSLIQKILYYSTIGETVVFCIEVTAARRVVVKDLVRTNLFLYKTLDTTVNIILNLVIFLFTCVRYQFMGKNNDKNGGIMYRVYPKTPGISLTRQLITKN